MRLTVITPSFNQAAYLERTLDSVLSQGYPDLEYIVVDGGSTDGSVEIIKRHEKHLAWWVSEADRGQSHALNKGLQSASGELLTWLNSDDWYLPGALEHFAEAAEAHPEASVLVGHGEMVDEAGVVRIEPARDGPLDLQTLLGWFHNWFCQPASAFRRELWRDCGPLDEQAHLSMDLDFWLRAAEAGHRFERIPHTLARAQIHADAKTFALDWPMRLETAHLLERHGATGEVKQVLAKLARDMRLQRVRLDWYRANYGIVTGHPLVRALQPIVKLLARNEAGYWREAPPPWVTSE